MSRIQTLKESEIPRWVRVIYWVILFQVLAVVYIPSFSAPFFYDGIHSIVENPDFRSAWTDVFRSHETSLQFDRRPVGGLLTWANFQVSGLNVYGYHVVNFIIHWLTAVALGEFTLLLCRRTGFAGGDVLSLGAAALWAVHPLNSMSVVYVYQRMETLMALFFVLSLWVLCVGAESKRKTMWTLLSVGAAVASLLSKEVAVVLPVVALVLDRCFLSGSWRSVWRERGVFYMALGLCWALCLWWILTGPRVVEVSHGSVLNSPWEYLKVQAGVVVKYLKLVFWPDPLNFLYMPQHVERGAQWIPQATFLITLVITVIVVGRRYAWVWIAGLAFFAILSPTSSVVPVPTESMAEYRMYLPSFAVVIAVLALAWAAVTRLEFSWDLVAVCFLVILVLLGYVTRQRLGVYESQERLWADVVAKEQLNAKGWANLGVALLNRADVEGATRCANSLLLIGDKVENDYATISGNEILAWIAMESGKWPETEKYLRSALKLNPESPRLQGELGLALAWQGRTREGLDLVEREHAGTGDAISTLARLAEVHYLSGNKSEYERFLTKAKALDPDHILLQKMFGRIAGKENR